VVGNNGHLYDKYWNGQQSTWEDQGLPPGATAVSSPCAVYQTTLDRLVCFVVGDNGRLYDNFWNGQQWAWEDQGLPAGATAVSQPRAAYQTALDRLVCFVVGNDGHLYVRFWNGRQWVWEDQGLPAGTTAVCSPKVLYQTPFERPQDAGRLHCFTVGNDGHLYDNYWNEQQRQWVWEDEGLPPGATAVSSLGAVYQRTQDRLYCFVVGNNGRLYDKYWNGQQSAWEDQGPFD
jgi:hypothetical protein